MKDKPTETENKTIKIVVLGGTGLIGSKVVNLLRAKGRDVVAASPSKGINSITGEGLTEALTGAQVVVDVTRHEAERRIHKHDVKSTADEFD